VTRLKLSVRQVYTNDSSDSEKIYIIVSCLRIRHQTVLFGSIHKSCIKSAYCINFIVAAIADKESQKKKNKQDIISLAACI